MHSPTVEIALEVLARLGGADLFGANLTGANFNGANLKHADFTRATGLMLDPRLVRLEQTQVEMDVMLRMATALGLKVVGC